MFSRLVIFLATLTLMIGSVANATVFSTLNADPEASRSGTKLGTLAGITIPRSGTGTAWLSATKPPFDLFVQAQIWQTTSFGPGTSLYTGVPFISNILVTLANGQLFQTADSSSTKLPSTRPSGAVWNNGTVPNPVGPGIISGMIAYATGSGQGRLGLTIGTVMPVLNLSKAGKKPVATTTVKIGTPAIVTIDATFGPYHLGSLTMTNITTNYIQMPGRALGEQTGVGFTLNPSTYEEVRTMTVGGNFITSFPDNALLEATQVVVQGTLNFPSSLNGTGTITLVTPVRLVTGEVAGTVPAFGRLKFSFVPEPGVALLLVSGAVGLVLFGRKRKNL
jgi:hypothetical protein